MCCVTDVGVYGPWRVMNHKRCTDCGCGRCVHKLFVFRTSVIGRGHNLHVTADADSRTKTHPSKVALSLHIEIFLILIHQHTSSIFRHLILILAGKKFYILKNLYITLCPDKTWTLSTLSITV